METWCQVEYLNTNGVCITLHVFISVAMCRNAFNILEMCKDVKPLEEHWLDTNLARETLSYMYLAGPSSSPMALCSSQEVKFY